MDAAGKCLLKPFCQKITKDPISLAHSMTVGLAVSKKPLGFRSPSTKMLFLTLVWILVRSLRLPPDPTEEEDGKPCLSPGALPQTRGLWATWEMVWRLRAPGAIISKLHSHHVAARSTSCRVCAFQETKLCCELLVMLIAFFPLEICSCFGPKYFKIAEAGSKSHGKKNVNAC